MLFSLGLLIMFDVVTLPRLKHMVDTRAQAGWKTRESSCRMVLAGQPFEPTNHRVATLIMVYHFRKWRTVHNPQSIFMITSMSILGRS